MPERPPILSVLLDNERKSQFQAIAQAEGRSMNWVIKDMIDRIIAANSIHIYGDSQPPPVVPDVLTEYVSKADMFDILKKYLQGDEVQSLIDVALGGVMVPPHSDLTIEDVQLAIETALSPIQNHAQLLSQSFDELRAELGNLRETMKDTASKRFLSEILERLDRVEAAINGARANPKATSTPKPPSSNGLDPETMKLVKRLEGDPALQAAVRAGMDQGLGGKALCEYLFEQGHGAKDGAKSFDPSFATRAVKAIEHLDNKGEG